MPISPRLRRGLALALIPCALAFAAPATARRPSHRTKRCHVVRVHGRRRCAPAKHARPATPHAVPMRHVAQPSAVPAPAPSPQPAAPAPALSGPTDQSPAGTSATTSTTTTTTTTTLPALRWAPPTLVNPITITLGTGYTHTSLSTSRDYYIKLPSTKKVGGTWLDGGHNIKIVGGAVTLPSTVNSSTPTAQRTGIYIKGATGTVHIEGVLMDDTGGALGWDGIDIAAPKATVQLENLRIVGVNGGLNSWHADVVQPWGGVKDLRIDRMSGASNYQGLMLDEDLGPIGSAEISNADMTATTDPTPDHGGHMLMVSKDTTACTTYPISLSSLYITPRPDRTLDNSVWPAAIMTDCPGLTGIPQLGPPPDGPFVPPGLAGLGYATPGYATP
jgi:hypothetical protein